MSRTRQCSRSYCTEPAAATLTYVYAESTAIVGPLAVHSEPHDYDLCARHATRLTVPRGWDVVRQLVPPVPPGSPSTDDLEALADAVREAARASGELQETLRRGHLRMLRSPG